MYSTNKSIFKFLEEDELLIGAWVAPPPKGVVGNKKTLITDQQYQFVKDSGINTIYALYERGDVSPSEVCEALYLAEKKGVHYLVRDERMKSIQSLGEYNELLEVYNSFKAFSGFLFWDEPGIIDFPRIKEIFDFSKRSKNPEKLVYVNLLPQYATNDQLWSGAVVKEKTKETIESKRYFEDYVSITRPTYLSYDFYPFEGKFPNIKAGFYEQYSEINKIAMNNNLPVMCFIQLVSFNENTRIPTQQEISFHVNVSLAYNTKGIQYFTYFLPTNDTTEAFKGAMINHNGERTEIYDSVRHINMFIKLVQADLKHAEWQGIESSANIDIPKCDKIYLDDININGDDIITGVYKGNECRLLYCVNTSLTEQSDVLIGLSGSKKVIVSSQIDLKQNTYDTNKPLLLTLQPGEANLIKIYNT